MVGARFDRQHIARRARVGRRPRPGDLADVRTRQRERLDRGPHHRRDRRVAFLPDPLPRHPDAKPARPPIDATEEVRHRTVRAHGIVVVVSRDRRRQHRRVVDRPRQRSRMIE